jgi:release factor glutamine methyltransferase
VTVAEALEHARVRLERAGVASARAEAAALLGALLDVSPSGLVLERTRELSGAEQARLAGWVARRAAREPLQHIVGRAYFYGLELRVTPVVLVPRPETEVLVELVLAALEGVRHPKVLDVGTGSGAIALALKAERPDAEVWATDLSAAALEVAVSNARGLGLEIRLAPSDLLGAPEVAAFAREAHALVSNPPYLLEADAAWLSPEVRRDPPEALFSGPDGLAHFRRLSGQARALLQPGARCLLELDPRNVAQARAESGAWAEALVAADLTGRPRFLSLRR